MNGLRAISFSMLRESMRKRTFLIVLILSGLFLLLFGWGIGAAIDDQAIAEAGTEFDGRALIGAHLLGLAMFSVLFLGAVLAVFLSMGSIRGEAERGVLQAIVVRPVGRSGLLLTRWLTAAAICTVYVMTMYLICALLTQWQVGWLPESLFVPALELGLAVSVITALSIAGSTVLAPVANGIAVFMLFGAGLIAGLLGQLGKALGAETLQDVSAAVIVLLPFEGMYQSALDSLTAGASGIGRVIVQLGPLGGAEQAGTGQTAWAVAYTGIVLALACWAFARRDL